MKTYYFFLFLLVCFLFSDCTETVEGCLNINAPNFDVEADEPCENCCDSSELTLAFIHKINPDTEKVTMQLNQVYRIFEDDSFGIAVNKFHFYLTGFKFTKSNGETITTTTQTQVSTSPFAAIGNNHAFISRNDVGGENLGRFEPNGIFEKIEFNFGLENDNNLLHPDSLLGTGHAFGWQADSTNWSENGRYSFLRLEYSRYQDTVLLDSIEPSVIQIASPNLQLLQIDSIFELKSGLNTRLTLEMDYNLLWNEIDFQNDTEETIKDRIILNIKSAILFNDINQE